jgi:hypothetical protein
LMAKSELEKHQFWVGIWGLERTMVGYPLITGTAPPSCYDISCTCLYILCIFWETSGAFQAPRLCLLTFWSPWNEDSGRLGVVKCAKQISTNKHDKLNWQGVQVSSRKFSGLLKTLQEGQAAIPSPSSPLMKNTHVEDPKQMNPVLSHGFWMYKAEGD